MARRRLPLTTWITIAAASLFATGLIGVATTSAGQSKPAAKVTIKGSNGSYKFKAKKVTINKGQTVKWSWNSDQDHNVTFDKGNKHSKTAMKVSDYRRTFKKKGTFTYFCSVHGFTGKVVVQ
jgi:plastocyanin